MPRFLLLAIFFAFLGGASPSNAAVYPNGKIFLFSGLAHTAFKRLNVPFPGWVQPDFRSLTRDRTGLAKFLNEIRGFFLSNRPENFARRQAAEARENSNGDFDANTLFPIRIASDAQIGNTIEIFIGVSLRKILTQVFASVFNIKEQYFVDEKDQETRPFGGGGFSPSPSGGGSSQTGFFGASSSGWLASQRTEFTALGDQQLFPASDPVDEQPERPFRVWRKRLANAMTNPVVIFCIVIGAMVSFAWRVSRASS